LHDPFRVGDLSLPSWSVSPLNSDSSAGLTCPLASSPEFIVRFFLTLGFKVLRIRPPFLPLVPPVFLLPFFFRRDKPWPVCLQCVPPPPGALHVHVSLLIMAQRFPVLFSDFRGRRPPLGFSFMKFPRFPFCRKVSSWVDPCSDFVFTAHPPCFPFLLGLWKICTSLFLSAFSISPHARCNSVV